MFGSKIRRSTRWRVFGGIVAMTAAAVAACSSSSSTTVPPTTGILIRAETLTAGRGCGTAPTQLYKYAVVLYGVRKDLVGTPSEFDRASYDQRITTNVFECFADGTFVSLSDTNGNATYRLEVFAYDSSAYGTGEAIHRAVRAPDAPTALRNTSPTWTTVCMATQQQDVQTLANCDPLVAGLGGLGGSVTTPTQIKLDTGTFVIARRPANCTAGTAPPDGGTDASEDAGEDAAAADADATTADADAAPPAEPLSFTQVRVRPRVRAAVVGPAQTVTCPAPYIADVDPAPATYQLDVELLDSAGNALGAGAQTVCNVSSQPGQTSSAVCP